MKTISNAAFRRHFRCVFGGLLVLAILSTGAAARAATPLGQDTITIASADAMSDVDMAMKRGSGGTSITVSASQKMNATTSGNTLDVGGNLTNGSISSVSFGGSGFGSYVMNTGNNSTINSGVSLSVLMLQ